MKKTLFTAAFLISSTAAMAQVSPAQVCQKISYNSTNAAKCAQVISRSTFDQGGVDVAFTIATTSSADTVNALNAVAGKRIEPAAASVCNKIASYNTTNAVACLSAIANNSYSPVATKVAAIIATTSSADTVNALKTAANAYMFAPAGVTCEKIASYNTTNAVRCLAAIANKDYLNGSEAVCVTIANTSSADAVTCLANTGVDYIPAPVPTDIIISSLELRNLRMDVIKARAQLDRGMIDKAQQTISDLLRTIETIEANNNGPRR